MVIRKDALRPNAEPALTFFISVYRDQTKQQQVPQERDANGPIGDYISQPNSSNVTKMRKTLAIRGEAAELSLVLISEFSRSALPQISPG